MRRERKVLMENIVPLQNLVKQAKAACKTTVSDVKSSEEAVCASLDAISSLEEDTAQAKHDLGKVKKTKKTRRVSSALRSAFVARVVCYEVFPKKKKKLTVFQFPVYASLDAIQSLEDDAAQAKYDLGKVHTKRSQLSSNLQFNLNLTTEYLPSSA